MAVAARTQNQQQRLVFRKATRQHFDLVGSIPYASGQTGRLTLPQVGFLAGLLLRVTGTMTLSADGVLAADGPWSLIRRVRVGLNTGIELINLSGFNLYVVNYLLKEEFNPAATGRPELYNTPALSGANTWEFSLYVPIAANDGLNFEVGLINAQTEELRVNLEIDWAPPTDAVSNATSFDGRADVGELFYEVPDPRFAEWPPLNVIHRVIDDRDAITGTGDVRKALLRQGTLLQLAHVVRLNGARNLADVEELRLEINRSDRVYRVPLRHQLFLQALRYGQDLPTGVFVWDWWHAQMDVSQGDGRDMVDTEAVAQLDSVVRIASGAVLGANNNFLDSIRRHTVQLRP